MNNPIFYTKHNNVQLCDATDLLNNYMQLIQWKAEDEYVLDVGCGTGNVTIDVLLPRLPKTLKKLVGIDISEEMVSFANSRYKMMPKVGFEQLDITTQNVPCDFLGAFHHIFSFHCFQWVRDYKKAFGNLFKMLKPGGSILLTFAIHSQVFEIYQALSENKHWKPYMVNFKQYVTPYNYSENPQKEIENLLEEIGFHLYVCELEHKKHYFSDVDEYIGAMMAINPMYVNIPDDLKSAYRMAYIEEGRKLNGLESHKEQRIFCHELAQVYAQKPSTSN